MFYFKHAMIYEMYPNIAGLIMLSLGIKERTDPGGRTNNVEKLRCWIILHYCVLDI